MTEDLDSILAPAPRETSKTVFFDERQVTILVQFLILCVRSTYFPNCWRSPKKENRT